MRPLALFKTHYSILKSLLTAEKAADKPEDFDPSMPDSICDIAKNNGLNELVVADESFSGFLEIYKNLSAIKVKLIYGLRLWMVPDIADKSDDSLKKQHRVNIFAKNNDGYKKLIRISSRAAQDGFYYEPRIDNNYVKEIWRDSDLKLAIPFYDSFIYQNNFVLGGSCIPDFSFTKPVFFVEDNILPMDEPLREYVEKYTSSIGAPIIPAKSIYYKNRKDFKAYMTARCLKNRTNLNKPNLDGMSSAEFCFESFLEMANGKK